MMMQAGRAETWQSMELIVGIVVLGQPVPKARPRVVEGHTYTPQRTKAYEELVGWTVRQRFPEIQPDGEHEYRVHATFYMDGRRRCDVDNLAKAGALDALNGIIWADDSQVVDLRAQVFRGSDDPRLELLIWRLD